MTAKRLSHQVSVVLTVLCMFAACYGWRALAKRTDNGAPSSANHQTELATLLNPDGTLKAERSFQGSVEARGWRLTATQEGAPRFVKVAPGDEVWDAQFTNALGVNGTVYALAVSGSDIYIGGSFDAVQGVAANNIARWNGNTWSALGEGISGTVYGLAVSGGNVYAGGQFFTAGETSVNNIAVWDGSSWAALGAGLTTSGNIISYVYALVVSGSEVYVGGQFDTAGDSPASSIAKWNGTTWSALGSGVMAAGSSRASVTALVFSGNDLYVGGAFTNAGGTAASNIARWNGSTWSALGAGLNSRVAALAISGSNVYAGGVFTGSGNVAASRIARWNGSAWGALGSGLSGGSFPGVNALAVSGNDVYVGGSFITAGGQPANRIARWNGSTWSALGSGIGQTIFHQVYALAVNGGELVTGGSFSTAGDVLTGNLARWNGSAWSSLGTPGPSNSVNGPVFAIALNGNDVYVGGNFNLAGGVVANNIAKWDGSRWSALGSGVDSTARAIAVSGNDVYVGGFFSTAGGVATNGVAKWNGSSWSALSNGLGSVYVLAIGGGNVYAGGSFTTVNGTAFNRVAVWNGSAWAPLGSGVNGTVLALAVNGNEVYAGGTFTLAGGNPAFGTAKWNGSTWSALGTDTVARNIMALALNGNELYAGGSFTGIGGVAANSVAKWNGSAWSPLGTGIRRGFVQGLAFSNNTLYAGGAISDVGGVPVRFIAKWDGSNWAALGSGVNTGVNAIAANANYVYVGGQFTTAGDKPSHYFGRYQQPCMGTLSATSQHFPASGGTGSVNVTAPACNWTATSNAAWVTITNGANGSGNGTVAFTVAANAAVTPRVGTLTIAGQTFTVTQAALVCEYTLAPLNQTASAAAGTGSVAVTANSGCAWMATSNAPWLTITSGASGTGNGNVVFTIAANPGTGARIGALTIAGQTATVNQSGALTNRLVRLAPAVGAAGSTVNVPVELVAQGDEAALSFSLGYDPAVLSNPQAAAGADFTGATLTPNLSQVGLGRIGLTLALPAGQRVAAGTRQAAVLTFTLAVNAPSVTVLNFGDVPTARLVADSAASPLPANYLGGGVTIAQPVASVSAASFSAGALAPEAMVAAFGTRLATRVEVANTLPLPTSLAGTSLKVRDSAGVERLAPLFFVAPGQLNYLVPAGTATGTASLTVTSGEGALSLGTLNIASVAPGLFAANANGQGVPAAVALRVKADGAQSFEAVAVFDQTRNQFVAAPLDVSVANERVFLILFGTGLRFRTALLAVSASLGGTNLPVSFAGAVGELAGLDQLNVELPSSLAGRGELDLLVTVEGRNANTLRMLLK